MTEKICVYASSSDALSSRFFETAELLGALLAANHCTLVYGAGSCGLMGHLARAVHSHGGEVIGVIPEALNLENIVYVKCDELHVTSNMRERKALMEERSSAFIALAGGFGTLEEVLEIITLKQLGYHNKPIAIINTDGFYDPLIDMFSAIVEHKFAKPESMRLFYIAADVSDALTYIESYRPEPIVRKWSD